MSDIKQLVEHLRSLSRRIKRADKDANACAEAADILEQVDALAEEWEAGRAPTAGAELRRALTPKEER